MTQNIRELLELAALACGYEWVSAVERSDGRGVMHIVVRSKTTEWLPAYWAPHIDDGDGARMEAQLLVDVQWGDAAVFCSHYKRPQDHVREAYADHNGNRQAARKMASLRVAAEIGRRMKT